MGTGKSWFCFWLALLLCWQVEGAGRRKVGLVLSGGGAKGVAHIGALKVLEEAGIPVDYVVGTSMGAIVGGLYAIGYDAASLDSMVRSQHWSFLLTDRVHRYNLPFSEKEKDEKFLLSIPMIDRGQIRVPSGFISGQNVRNLFTELTLGYHDSLSFSRLPVPYACVAANLSTGEEVVLDHGVLSRAMQASMAMPGVFAPVRWWDMLLVDGGIANNFPTDVCREMGADILIGVDVTAGLKKVDELNSIVGIANQLPLFLGREKYEENLPLCDLYIKPDIGPYSAGSFDPQGIDSLLQRGERAARKQWNELLALKEALGVEPAGKNPADERGIFHPQDSLIIGKIRIEGAGKQAERWIRRKIGLAEYSYVSSEEIHRAASILYGTGAFGQVNYALSGGDVNDLTFTLKTKDPGSLNFGFRFDSEMMAAILLNTVLSWKKLRGVELSVTGKLGQNPWAKAECSLGAGFLRRANLSYMYKYHDLNLYILGRKMTNTTFSQHTGELNFSDIYIQNCRFILGVRYDFFDVNAFIYLPAYKDVETEVNNMLVYQVQAQYETLDKRYYPTKGVSFQGAYALHTDNGFRYNDRVPFGALAGYFTTVHRLDDRLVLQPELYGRILIGQGVPFTHMNYIGGEAPGRYFSQQLPFAGVPRVEPVENSFLAGGLTFRYRIGAKHYVTAKCNYGRSNGRFWDLLQGKEWWGGEVAYSYDSLIGPVDGRFGLSNRVKKTGFYFNLGYCF